MPPKNTDSEKTTRMDVPVLLTDGTNYDKFKICVVDWSESCGIQKKKQALVLRQKLPEIAFDASENIDRDILKSDKGVDAIIEVLDSIYVPDKLNHGRSIYRKYKNLKRQDDEPMVVFIQKFLNMYNACKKYNTNEKFYSENWVAIDLLDACVLSEEDEKIVTAQMIEPANLINLTSILKRVFTSKTENKTLKENKDGNSGIFMAKSENEGNVDQSNLYEEPSTSLYTRNNYRRGTYRPPRRGRFNKRLQKFQPYSRRPDNRNSTNFRRNPIGPDGKPYLCNYCESPNHFIRNCSAYKEEREKRNDKNNKHPNPTHVSLLSFVGCASKNDDKLQELLSESHGYALLDSGCSNTVAGKEWIDQYISNLSVEDRNKVKIVASGESFTFGDGKTHRSLRKITFPCWIGGGTADITTDVVESKIPLLLSRRSMSKVGMIIDFHKHTAIVNGRHIKLKRTYSGHYGLPISL